MIKTKCLGHMVNQFQVNRWYELFLMIFKNFEKSWNHFISTNKLESDYPLDLLNFGLSIFDHYLSNHAQNRYKWLNVISIIHIILL